MRKALLEAPGNPAPSALPKLGKARLEMIDAGGRVCQLLGLPRSTGQIYGLLFLSTEPLDLDEIAALLGISKASASTGTRQLLAWHAIKQIWIMGERRDHFEVDPELGNLLKAGYNDFIKPRLTTSQNRLDRLAAALDRDLASGAVTEAEHELYTERLENFRRLRKKVARLLPLAERLL